MRKFKLFFAAALSMIAWTGAMAQTQHNADNYDAAKAAIVDGETYRIKTTVSGTDYYVTTTGALTSVKDDAGFFKITKTSGGYFGTGFRIYGTSVFTNPPLSNNVANLYPGYFAYATGSNDRADWERQILYRNSDGKYAIRSCNCADGTSSWNDAARTHWTYYMVGDVVTPCYSYTAEYIWDFEVPPTIVNVTYKLYESDGTTLVSTASKQQEANSQPSVPTSMLNNYIYTYTINGTIGGEDCEIIVVRTIKSGVVQSLSGLSNNKAYVVRCDRGAFLTKNDYLASTAHNSLTTSDPTNFAVITYEDNKYLYSIVDEKFVTYSGALEAMPIHGTEDAFQLTPKEVPYFLGYFTYGETPTNYGVNTNGNDPYGYVINTWMNADPGNMYFFIEAADFDPTDALAALQNYFHPSYFVTYVVKDEFGNTLLTSDEIPTTLGAHITSLPADYHRPFYTYNNVDVTISNQKTTVEFTATWNGPFKLSKDFDNAEWQNMAVRGSYYVTSGNAASDGSLAPILANASGLVEDAYQWAFVGSGYAGFKLFNKAKGANQVYAWVSNDNSSIPTFVDVATANVWTIKASTSTVSGAFMLTTDMGYQVNQFGGASGSLKIWQSTGTGDAGSAFTVFDVPTNFAPYVVEEIAPYFDSTAKYFVFSDAAKAEVGYDPAYKTDCPYDAYKNMKDKLTATFVGDLSNYVLPETGYYILKNKYYGTYMGIDPSDGTLWGNYTAANAAKNIVKLTKNANNTYTIGLMGKYAPSTVTQSQPVIASTMAGTYTVVITTLGCAAFKADPSENMSCLHRRAEGDIVGWEAAAEASMWEAIDAIGIGIDLTIGETGYATTYQPFPVAIPEGVTVYTAKIAEKDDYQYLELAEVKTTIPELTAVILKANPATYTFTIGEGMPEDALGVYDTTVEGEKALVKAFAEPINDNVLKGTLEPIDAVGKYILAKPKEDEAVGFWQATTGKIAAGKAYLEVSSDVKAFFFNFDDATGLKDLNDLKDSKDIIFNIAGQRLNKMQKGINIVNGKKIATK